MHLGFEIDRVNATEVVKGMSAMGKRPVVDLATSTIRDAMQAIQDNSTSLVAVTSQDMHLVGVISDGDVRRALLGGRSLEDSVAEIVRKDPVVVKQEDSRATVVDLMQARGISAIPVVDDKGDYRGMHLLRQLLGRVPRANTAVVMAGGRGSRLLPPDSPIPKPMVKVAGRPILERLISHLVGYGVTDIVISVGFRAEVIQEFFGSGEQHGCRIQYVREDAQSPRGTAGALSEVRRLASKPDEPFLVLNGDLVTQANFASLFEEHSESGAAVTIATHVYTHEVPFGVIEHDSVGRVSRVVEKPTLRELVSAGIYALNPEVLDFVPIHGSFHMTDLIDMCLSEGHRVGYWEGDDDWIDVGRPGDLAAARGLDR